MDPDPDPGLTIVILGNTGVGKSATGNTILGQTAFESKRSFRSVTTKISEATETLFGKQISVIDTPGILGSEQLIRTLCQDHLKSSRPCLFLVVVKIDRFTEEQEKAVEAAISVLGEQGLDKSYLLFTHGDTLDKTVEDFIYEEDECPLPKLVERFKDKYLAFNNKHGGQEQVRELLGKSDVLPRASVPLENRRIVLFGLSGCGKSSSGNTILGSERFKSDCDFEAVSSECVSESAIAEGRQVTVLDTPGFTDEGVSPEMLGLNIIKTVKEASPGIHAFVIVVKIGRVFEAEASLLKQLPTLFGRDANKYTMVLFTHGDELRSQCVDEKIRSSRRMSELVSMCCGRYCVFDNTDRRNRLQVQKFLDQVDEMVSFNGGEPCPIDELNTAIGNVSVRPRSGQISQFERRSEETPGQTVREAQGIWAWIMWLVDLIRSLFNREQANTTYSLLTQPLLA
ncbi:GTPase IMAP family member 8-like [Seriola aureovittata]|uniref:GTPase IMAP family member 8-like n=1 Tax=Seriola aureovittata TaxID=2871759 RepID=UPI0024BDA9BE|nr:GTPase IMAP family member 8-like [Seriola aureovittata]XP_056253438.1 GTPase IMAP family member 8-like [Seriola aureovittata]